MTVTKDILREAIGELGLGGRTICVHSSLRSFGTVEGGAETVVEAMRDEGCTLLVPAFSWYYAVSPPAHLRPTRNGWHYENSSGHEGSNARVYSPASTEIDADMGAIARAVLQSPQLVRGDHPLCSFAAIGPLDAQLVAGQHVGDVFAPLRALAQHGGAVLLMGVGLTKMTLLHLAEKQAGRTPFVRWANNEQGLPLAVQVGGCSSGFDNFTCVLEPLRTKLNVGSSNWSLYPAQEVLAHAGAAIKCTPSMTHCANPNCERCNDAIAGGPILG